MFSNSMSMMAAPSAKPVCLSDSFRVGTPPLSGTSPIASSPSKGSSASVEIRPEDLTFESLLAEGGFGQVWRGTCRHKPVAIKVCTKTFDEQTLQEFRHEVEVMSLVAHPNCLLFMGACTSVPGKLMICTELMPRGDLDQLLVHIDQKEKTRYSLQRKLRMAHDTALGVNWLHKSTPIIIHRDLKLRNLLVDEHLRVKVGDFGISQYKETGVNISPGSEVKGTMVWMAPEILSGACFDEKVDIYSFGLCLWQIISQKPLSPETQTIEEFIKAVAQHHARPSLDGIDSKIASLIQACWHPDPTQRPDFSSIITAIEEIIVNIAISDDAGKKIWQQYFRSKFEVSWKDFVNVLGIILSIVPEGSELYTLLKTPAGKASTHYLNFRCLKAVLVNEKKMVTMEDWGKTLARFGDLSIDRSGLLDKVRLLCAEPWFHGDLSTSNAESQLFNKDCGCFLVRFSTSERGYFTISRVAPKVQENALPWQYKEQGSKIIHHRIPHVFVPSIEEYFTFNGKHYKNIVDLIQNEYNTLQLSIPCAGSKFSKIFRTKTECCYSYG